MKAILLAAGQGSRLLPLTLERPKCLVPVGGRAILDHQLDACAAAGVEQAVVIGGYRIAQIAAHLAARPAGALPVRLIFNPFWAVASSIGSVWAARDLLRVPFCLMNGDSSFAPALIERAIADPPRGVALVVEPLRVAEEDDMLVRVADDAVLRVSKALGREHATHRSLGIVLGGEENGYARALARVIADADGPAAYHHDVIDALAQTERVAARIETSGDWIEVDRPEDIRRWTERRDA